MKRGSLQLVRLAGASLVLGAVALTTGVTPVAGAGGKKDESQVKLAATATKLDAEGRQVVTISVNVNSGWHIYANPVQFKDLEAVQTTVKITSANKLHEVKISYPPGKRHTLDKDTFYIYEGKIEITAIVKRAGGDVEPLDVSVKYMSCTDKVCKMVEQVTLQVK
jgi:DsbC/DsbD-like thiol-disulfide interchange protein